MRVISSGDGVQKVILFASSWLSNCTVIHHSRFIIIGFENCYSQIFEKGCCIKSILTFLRNLSKVLSMYLLIYLIISNFSYFSNKKHNTVFSRRQAIQLLFFYWWKLNLKFFWYFNRARKIAHPYTLTCVLKGSCTTDTELPCLSYSLWLIHWSHATHLTRLDTACQSRQCVCHRCFLLFLLLFWACFFCEKIFTSFPVARSSHTSHTILDGVIIKLAPVHPHSFLLNQYSTDA